MDRRRLIQRQGVRIGTRIKQESHNLQVSVRDIIGASSSGTMERRPLSLVGRVDLRVEEHELLHHLEMALVTRDMQRRLTLGVDFEHLGALAHDGLTKGGEVAGLA